MSIQPIINREILMCPSTLKVVHMTPSVLKSDAVKKTQKVFSDYMDSTIDGFIESGTKNIISRMKFHKILELAMPRVMTPENFINKGRESAVYRISDKYVVKVGNNVKPNKALSVFDVISVKNKKFTEIPIYYGEPVVKTGKIEILKNATPSEDFVTCGTSFVRDMPVPTLEKHKYEKDYLPKCSSLPQVSFDEFAESLQKMNSLKKGKYGAYTPDVRNPNNILISDNKFKLVDKLETTCEKEPNTLYTMLEPLMLRFNPYHYTDRNSSLTPMRREIFRKSLIASEKHNLPLEDKNSRLENVLNENLELNAKLMIKTLSRMRNSDKDLKARVAYINQELLPHE